MLPFVIDPLSPRSCSTDHTWIVYDVSELSSELGRLAAVAHGEPTLKWCHEDEWRESLIGFLSALGDHPVEPRATFLSSLLELWSPEALWRLRTVVRHTQEVLRDSSNFHAHGTAEPTRCLLLPAPYPYRMAEVLLLRKLSVAWLMQLDLSEPVPPPIDIVDPRSVPTVRVGPPRRSDVRGL